MTTPGTGQAPCTVYLDYSATTPLRPEVLQAMWPYFAERPGNASSLHAVGQQAKRALEES
jgi:cysteine desulfurase